MTLERMREELRQKYKFYRAQASSNPNREERVTPTRVVEAIVDLMDWATLWRWKTAIDKRLERERVNQEEARKVLERWTEQEMRK